ncbi:MAG: hypothetical protein JWL69_3053 [Phycisphaerales bacterium]|jgi:hypothetical protein|nr:hypothetical protein [Phycisphaerales bacterium]
MSETIPPPLPENSGNRPTPLEYRTAGAARSPEERRKIWRRFFGGLILGTLVSAVIWVAGFDRLVNHGSGLALFLVPGVKFGAGITALCMRGWRSFGAGILVSIALGFLIFFGMCASSLKF